MVFLNICSCAWNPDFLKSSHTNTHTHARTHTCTHVHTQCIYVYNICHHSLQYIFTLHTEVWRNCGKFDSVSWLANSGTVYTCSQVILRGNHLSMLQKRLSCWYVNWSGYWYVRLYINIAGDLGSCYMQVGISVETFIAQYLQVRKIV